MQALDEIDAECLTLHVEKLEYRSVARYNDIADTIGETIISETAIGETFRSLPSPSRLRDLLDLER